MFGVFFVVVAVMLPYTGANDERVVFYTSKSKVVRIHSLNNKQVDDDNEVDKHQTAFCIYYCLLQFYHLIQVPPFTYHLQLFFTYQHAILSSSKRAFP